jgi:hypothetical protein
MGRLYEMIVERIPEEQFHDIILGIQGHLDGQAGLSPQDGGKPYYAAPDVIMPRTRRESLRNKIAELSNSGLNSNEIADYLKKVSKGELIRIIRDYQEV